MNKMHEKLKEKSRILKYDKKSNKYVFFYME